jgi:phosphoglycerate dehydrogenase-like enzyme
MYVLIADSEAADYAAELAPRFPGAEFHAVATEAEIGPHAAKMEVLITIFRVADHVLAQAKNLRWIQVMGTGVNHLFERPSLGREVIITSCRGIHGPQMAEMAFLLMLAFNRKFPAVVKNQDAERWERWPGELLWEKTAGILGMGVIGEAVADRCHAFGMKVVGIDIFERPIASVDEFRRPGELLEIAGSLDYLILTAPATPETHHIVGEKLLNRMKRSAYLINIARGELVDEAALREALEAGKIAGAGLDALPVEPLPAGHPLWKTKNVIITPHVGGMSDIYRRQIMPILSENLTRFLKGERRDLINFIER